MNIYDPLNLIFVGFIKSRFATSEFSPKNVTLDFFAAAADLDGENMAEGSRL